MILVTFSAHTLNPGILENWRKTCLQKSVGEENWDFHKNFKIFEILLCFDVQDINN